MDTHLMEEQIKKILGLLVSNLRKTENFLLAYSVFCFWCLNHTQDPMTLIRWVLQFPLSIIWIMKLVVELWFGSITCFQQTILDISPLSFGSIEKMLYFS